MDASATRYTFRGFVLEPAERRLSRDGIAVDLPSKIFDVLSLLVRRAGHLVSKDEFHATLWPRQIVSEATLNKYVWQLRRTLGEGEGDEKLIETVPRQGYRFVAAVSTQTADADSAMPLMPASTPARHRLPRRMGVLASLGIAAIFIAGVVFLRPDPHRGPDAAPDAAQQRAPGSGRHALALAPTDVADGLPAWLGAALPELLARELAMSEQVLIVPRSAAAFEFPRLIADAGAASHEDLVRWRALGADFLLMSVAQRLPGGAADEIRLQLRLVDTVSGRSFGDATATGSDAHLDRLIGAAGERVRSALGLNPLSDSLMRMRDANLPRDSGTARRYAEAIGFLSARMDSLALDRLGEVTRREPDFVAAWLELARAELDQGYAARASQSAGSGLAHAAAAPRELRLSLEAVQFEANGAWARAVETWQALYRFFPDQPDYALRLMGAQVSADDKPAAEQTLKHLRALPGLAEDARVLLAEYQLARGMDDWTRAHGVATRMLVRAAAMQSGALRARALALRASASIALRDYSSARADLDEARTAFVESDDRNGLAQVELLLGNERLLGGDLASAERHYREAVGGYRALGARWNENIALDNLMVIAITRGDPVAARTPVEDLLTSTRALGDTLGEGRALVYLAWVELDAGHTAAALGVYREAVALNERAGNRAQHVAALANLANLFAMTGRPAPAREAAERALAVSDGIDDGRYRIVAIKALGSAARARGDSVAARAAYAQARLLAAQAGDHIGVARIDIALAEVDFDERATTAALDRLAAAEPVLADSTRDLVTLTALRARALSAQRQVEPARAALATSRELVEKTSGYLDHLPFRLAEVQVLAAGGETVRARALAAVLRVELGARDLARDLAQLDGAVATIASR